MPISADQDHDHNHNDKHDHDHARSHDTAHNHHAHHGHGHGVVTGGSAFALGAALNLAFVIVEIMLGLRANSLALLADAGHNFVDVIGLLLAWGAIKLAEQAPSARFTYGLR